MDLKLEFDRAYLPQYQRYNELFNKTSLTPAEELEFNSLSATLYDFQLKAADWNNIVNLASTPTIQQLSDSVLSQIITESLIMGG